jgi:sulfatase maturation enzyme AslB (radical SAM superfamily)
MKVIPTRLRFDLPSLAFWRRGQVPGVRHCSYLASGMSFYADQITACGIIHHDTGMPKLADYSGGPIPWELIQARRAEMIRENQADGHPACRGCPHLGAAAAKVKRPPDRLTWLGISHLNVCNLECEYCWLQWANNSPRLQPGPPAGGYRVLEQIVAMHEAGRIDNKTVIDWGGGGDPTLMVDFADTVAYLAHHGLRQWIHTNAVKLSPRLLDPDLVLDKVGVLCSIDSGFPHTYKAIKRRDRLDQVWEHLAALRRRNAVVVAKYIVTDRNSADEELVEFVRRARAVEVSQIDLDIDHRHPEPEPHIIAALARLKWLALVPPGIEVRVGSTGINSCPERDVKGLVEEAFRALGPVPEQSPAV